MLAAIVILGLVCALLALRVYALERGLRSGAEQLRRHRETADPAPLRLAAPNAAAEALLSEVNRLLRDREEERTAYRAREEALRRQIANVSHDLRTPLTSILGYLQLLEDQSLTAEQRREYLSVAKRRARVLQDLISGFYDLSRLEAGEYPIEREKVDLREVLGELLAAYYDELEGKFTVTVDLPDDLPPVWGDRRALSRVYANLLRNALDHGSGRLILTARAGEGFVETRLTNGGAVLTSEDLPHVFDRSFTADRARDKGNTGLGLAIVKALAQRMGGTVTAELLGEDFTVVLRWKQSRRKRYPACGDVVAGGGVEPPAAGV